MQSANKFRIAVPPSAGFDVSGRYWNQVSSQIHSSDYHKFIKEKMQQARGGPSASTRTAPGHRAGGSLMTGSGAVRVKREDPNFAPDQSELSNIHPVASESNILRAAGTPLDYEMGDIAISKPFTFLANLGGKQTSH